MRRITALILALTLCLTLVSVMAENADNVKRIILSDQEIEADYPGVYAEGSILTITLPGDYLLTGSLSSGRIVVQCEEEGKVRLLLGGVDVHSEDGPALHILKARPRMTIELADGTENTLSDGKKYHDSNGNADAVIFSKSDLTITGTGTLKVEGAYRDGIVSKDDLRIKGGKIRVQAVHNGICGKDSVEIYDGDITVIAGNDGIRTTNDDPDWGFILLEGGKVDVTAGDDPVKFVYDFSITGGTFHARVDESLAAE